MENQKLEDYALICECAEEAARFGILLDFLKQAGSYFYSLRAKGKKAQEADIELLKNKFQELEDFISNIVSISE